MGNSSNFWSRDKHRHTVVQIHPRALPREKECGDCSHFVHNVDPQKRIGWCKLNEEATTNYDECSAFSPAKD